MERYRKTIYCDWEFLTALLSKQDEKVHCLDNSSNIDNEVVSDIFSLLLCSDVKLYLNIPQAFFYNFHDEAEMKNKSERNSLEKLVIDMEFKRHNSTLHLHFNPSKVQFNDSILDKDRLNALFFSRESKEECAKAMEEFGVIVFCAENVNDFKYLTFDQGVALHKAEISNWSQCLGGHEIVPCNSLVIVDNYILNDSDRIEENLRNIFESLIPKHLNESMSFHVTIFSTLCNDRGIPYNSAPRFERVRTILNEIRPNIAFCVSIIKCSKDKFHDRTIITNNLYIGCGGGFDLFKNGKAQKTTTVCILHPFLNDYTKWSRKAYSDVLNDTRRVFNDTTAFDESRMTDSFPSFAIGDKSNRLLEQE